MSLKVPETVDMATAMRALSDLGARLGAVDGKAAVSDPAVDLSGLKRFDSALLAVLLELRRRAGATRFVGAPDKLLALARLYGVEDLLFGSAPGAETAPATGPANRAATAPAAASTAGPAMGPRH